MVMMTLLCGQLQSADACGNNGMRYTMWPGDGDDEDRRTPDVNGKKNQKKKGRRTTTTDALDGTEVALTWNLAQIAIAVIQNLRT